MILGNMQYRYSPLPHQSYIWVADYWDNTFLSEYDTQINQYNNFYSINKEKLLTFGYIGEGSQVYFDVANGIFNVNGHRFMISYATEENEYPLTGRTYLYNDIIQYKDASSNANLLTREEYGKFDSRIEQYNIGYKKEMLLLDANINFQCICSMPLRGITYFQIKITSNKDLDGKLIIRCNGIVSEEIHAPLKANMSGNIHWELR
ncbi:hypothetical protein G9G63_09970 [Paenibacillus sp. EKM202P]|uniref:hypothetical protein n=1 Tax=unclassified Paenibacillus TaxID=185978 RepID=UPI0013EAF9A6|nr:MULTISPECIES: hypothetical protein [unclassified Paenibacillus]KAF6565474.1 hypothetical protein G9G63_09970 [Paenibacillus sp. EKM202P]KAF6569201.1 hypothetical protein G9G64_12125 [Paenibacillus sp. EKM207P]